jgi:hypothetical protein
MSGKKEGAMVKVELRRRKVFLELVCFGTDVFTCLIYKES